MHWHPTARCYGRLGLFYCQFFAFFCCQGIDTRGHPQKQKNDPSKYWKSLKTLFYTFFSLGFNREFGLNLRDWRPTREMAVLYVCSAGVLVVLSAATATAAPWTAPHHLRDRLFAAVRSRSFEGHSKFSMRSFSSAAADYVGNG